eukprot:CAMPEP_0169399200 /NCGR_PEP_ID=MMETSP1017-20121227/53077_1 /TAXON_ID=342587 /ORGANISM="Karlodinium micrum, Strain CCMP2283" /LENGTH=58 /DNA_ID=CAMNT_0009504295 /DNA_START=48 /DNA_END=221 /DNA_ORIENTATION=-
MTETLSCKLTALVFARSSLFAELGPGVTNSICSHWLENETTRRPDDMAFPGEFGTLLP